MSSFAVALTTLLLALSGAAEAWWSDGHLIVAQLARDEIAQMESGQEMLDSLNAMINDTGLFFPDTGDVVAVATWADDLHGRFDTSLFASWHFANLPFVMPNTTAKLDLPPPLSAGNNVLATLQQCNRSLAELDGHGDDVHPRGKLFVAAFCVRWLIHVVGDAHQPLHAIDGFSNRFPGGDHGGNKCKITVPDAPDVTSLHMLWDSAGLQYGNNFAVPLTAASRAKIAEQAAALRKQWPRSAFTHSQLTDRSFGQWVNESFAIGERVGYQNGTFQCESNVTAAYVTAVRVACDERIALAGYRLAELMRSISPRHYTSVLPQYCSKEMHADDEYLHVDIRRTTLYYSSVGAVVVLIGLLVCMFCLGKSRGKSVQNGPMHFERIP